MKISTNEGFNYLYQGIKYASLTPKNTAKLTEALKTIKSIDMANGKHNTLGIGIIKQLKEDVYSLYPIINNNNRAKSGLYAQQIKSKAPDTIGEAVFNMLCNLGGTQDRPGFMKTNAITNLVNELYPKESLTIKQGIAYAAPAPNIETSAKSRMGMLLDVISG